MHHAAGAHVAEVKDLLSNCDADVNGTNLGEADILAGMLIDGLLLPVLRALK